jgi:hypothetical protein
MDDNALDIILKVTDELTPALRRRSSSCATRRRKVAAATSPRRIRDPQSEYREREIGSPRSPVASPSGNILATSIEKIASVAIAAAKALPELAMQGARVDDVADAYKRLTTQAGHVVDVLLETLRQGTHGTIDDFTLMQRVEPGPRRWPEPHRRRSSRCYRKAPSHSRRRPAAA